MARTATHAHVRQIKHANFVVEPPLAYICFSSHGCYRRLPSETPSGGGQRVRCQWKEAVGVEIRLDIDPKTKVEVCFVVMPVVSSCEEQRLRYAFSSDVRSSFFQEEGVWCIFLSWSSCLNTPFSVLVLHIGRGMCVFVIFFTCFFMYEDKTARVRSGFPVLHGYCLPRLKLIAL